MQNKARKWIYAIVIIGLVISICMMVQSIISTKKAEEARRQAEEMAKMEETTVVETAATEPETTESATEPEKPTEPEYDGLYYADEQTAELKKMNLEALQEKNPDVLGWIMIPDSKLSYPLLQGEDNDYYLHHTWEYEESSAGSIFLEHLVSGDLSDYNTIVYGHRMRDRSMFGNLVYFEDPEYLAAHPYVYIVNDEGCHTYRVFSAHEAGVKTITYRIGELDEKERQEYIKWSLDHSVIETGEEPTVENRILTMVTCTGKGYDARWVVQAYHVGTDPRTGAETETGVKAVSAPESESESGTVAK